MYKNNGSQAGSTGNRRIQMSEGVGRRSRTIGGEVSGRY